MKSKLFTGNIFARLTALGVCSTIVISLTARAATSTWDGALGDVWDTTTANWTGATFTSGNDALFTGTPTNNVATAAGLTIGAITLDNTFTGSVSLTGNNIVSGATSISGGTLLVKHSGTAIGTVTATDLGTSAVTVNAGGQLYVDDEGNGTAGGERILALGNTILGAGTLQVRASSLHTNGWSSANFTGDLSGFTGTFNIIAGSTINRGKVKFTAASQAAVLSSSATVNVANGAQLYLTQAYNYGFAVHVNGGTGGENNGSIRLDNATLDLTGSVTLHADSTISGAGRVSGTIGQSGGSYRLTKVGNNTTVLTGSNSYDGGTTISAGTVSVGNNNSLGSGTVTMGGGSLSNTTGVTLANNFTLNNGTTFTAGNGTMTLNGNITGSPNGIWNLTPTNKITLAGINSITNSSNFGGFNINAGAGGVDITGSTTITGNVANQQSGYLNMVGTTSLSVKSGASLAINGTTHATFPTSIIGQNAAGTSTLAVDGGNLIIGANTAIAFGNNIGTAIGVLTVSSGTATIQAGSTTATDSRSFVMLGKDLATGTINLNGGTLETGRRFLRDGSGTADASGAANFVFGGGTLKALASQTDWLNSATVNTNQQPLTSVTVTADSIIDSNGFSVGINNAISGAGGITIADSSGGGTGVVTLGGANTYTGTTQVNSGTLAVTGSLTSSVSVATAGKLAVGGISPSTTMASLALSSLSMNGSGNIAFDVTAPADNDQVIVTTASGLAINGGSVSLYDAGTTNALTLTGTFTLINYSGTLTGSVSGLTVANPRVGYAYAFADTGSAVTVTVSLTSDTDGDGMPDTWEDAHGLNKLVNDAGGNPDGDFSTNYEEYLAGSDPQDPNDDPLDTDLDDLRDSWEITYFTTISAQDGIGDPDGDFATNKQEHDADTDPGIRTSSPDLDNDGIGDAWEIHFLGDTTTANAESDYDSDTVSDLDEYLDNTDPLNDKDPYSGTAVVTWSSPVTVTSDSDIITSGTLLHAGNFRSDNIGVDVLVGSQTITFDNRPSQDAPGDLLAGEEAAVIAGSGGRQVNGGLFDATGTTVGTAFESVLDGSAWENTDPGPYPGATDMILRVTGVDGTPLVIGQEYQIQLFYSDDRAGNTARGQIFHDNAAGGNASSDILAGDSSYVVGTFTASDVGYQDIFIRNTSGGANFPVALNAYVLRTVPVSNDTDTDGMDDTWETSYFGDLSQTAAGDFEGDGTDNLTEYRLGLTPDSGTSRFAVTRTTTGLLEWPSAIGVTFTVQRSETLTGWTDIATIPGTAGTASYTDPAPPIGKAFYRILLEP